MSFSFARGSASRKVCIGVLPKTPPALVWSTIIVFDQPSVEIGLQLVERVIDLFAERDPVVAQQRASKRRDGLPPTALTANKVIAAWFDRLIPGGRDTADRLFAAQRTDLGPAVAV
jgi:hypothetical protein